MGRYSLDEIATFAGHSYAGLASLMQDKPYLLGDEPCGADASVFAHLASILTPYFSSRIRDVASRHANLLDYTRRLMMKFYPGFAWDVS